MSILNIELDFVKDNERLAKISVISHIIEIIAIALAIGISLYFIILYIHDIILLPLYNIFMVISMAILVGSFVHFYPITVRYSTLKEHKIKEKAMETIRKLLKKILVPILIGIIIMAAVSLTLPSYRNVDYTLSPGKVVSLNQSINFDSALIHGIFISGNGVTLIYGNEGSIIVVNDSIIGPNNEIILYQNQEYKVIQKSGTSNIIVQYAGNYYPYYASLITEILAVMPSLFFMIKFRRES